MNISILPAKFNQRQNQPSYPFSRKYSSFSCHENSTYQLVVINPQNVVLLIEDGKIVFTQTKKSFLGIGRKFKFAVTMKYTEDSFQIMKTRELGDKLKLFLEKKTTFLPEYFRIGSLIKRKRQGSIE